MIHPAAIDNAGLERLVLEHRDNAGRAERLFGADTSKAAHYAGVQNGFADIYQELLDRRRWAATPKPFMLNERTL